MSQIKVCELWLNIPKLWTDLFKFFWRVKFIKSLWKEILGISGSDLLFDLLVKKGQLSNQTKSAKVNIETFEIWKPILFFVVLYNTVSHKSTVKCMSPKIYSIYISFLKCFNICLTILELSATIKIWILESDKTFFWNIVFLGERI